jgi:hypothetical protein
LAIRISQIKNPRLITRESLLNSQPPFFSMAYLPHAHTE